MDQSDSTVDNVDAADAGDTHSHSRRHNLIFLIAVIAAGALLVQQGSGPTLLVVLAVVAAVMIHEAGHYVAAKAFNMKVTEFFLGFGRRLFSVRKGETEYGVKAIPAGGYVKIIGMNNLEEVDPSEEHRTYRQGRFLARLAVGMAGCLTHFIVAGVIAFVLLAFVGSPVATLTVGALSEVDGAPGPAQSAGIQEGDRIVALDGQRLDSWDEVPTYVGARANTPIEFQIERDAALQEIVVTPTERVGPNAEPTGFVGIATETQTETTPVLSAIPEAGSDVVELTGVVIQSLGQMFSPSGVSDYASNVATAAQGDELGDDANRFLSPLGLVQVADDAADSGLPAALSLLFVINIFIGIINLVPLPPFDGGHAAVAIYEKIRSRPGRRHVVDYAKLLPVAYGVLLVFGLIALTALFLDITSPVPNLFE